MSPQLRQRHIQELEQRRLHLGRAMRECLCPRVLAELAEELARIEQIERQLLAPESKQGEMFR